MNLNKAMVIGNVVRDPEMRTTPGGQNVTSFSVATNFVWKDAAGQKQEKAEFHNIVAWRRLAEITNQYLKKGAKVYIEGRMQTRSWDDPNGVKRYRTEIIADNMIMLDRAGNQDFSGANSAPRSNDRQPSYTNNMSEGVQPAPEPSEEEISIEDIPF
ncbi:MAG: single-strand DNA-binding protein [Patescibacteria group bacterium]|nr:single-strand DNA-binding protein [Patescibacteria group bacterium]MDQ5970399.1 single-strand DNA-binding protein [Patescibacteria group bacterium]